MKTHQFTLALVAAAALSPLSSFAASTWAMWDNTAPVACTTSNATAQGNSYSCAGTAVADPTMTVTAWATTGSGSTFAQASVQRWDWTPPAGTPITGQTSGYDYGVVNATGGSGGGVETSTGGQHSMDNNGATDVLALSFAKATALTSVSLGWYQTDADISVLRYTGTATTLAAAINGKTIAQLIASAATGGGWELVGHYADLQSDVTAPIETATITGGLTSSWWLISAFNASYGVGTTSNGGTTTANTALQGGNDYVKLLQVAGNVTSGSSVPEPGSIALVGAGLLGVLASRRRKSDAV